MASRYSVLQLLGGLGFQTGLWIPHWTPLNGVAATFIVPVHDVHGDVSPCMQSTGNWI